MIMIHRPADTTLRDPFVLDEKNPNNTRAIDSSLWEIASHRSHYHPIVATMSQIFEEKFTKPEYNLGDFLDHTYTTVRINVNSWAVLNF